MFQRITNSFIILALSLGLFSCQAKTTPESSLPATATSEPQAQPTQVSPTDAGFSVPTDEPVSVPPTGTSITLATTGFTRDTGLLNLLIKDFTARTGVEVNIVVRVNPNQVLQDGSTGQADVLLVHSPDAEVSFVEKGYGIERRLVMHNDFLIIGPDADPASVRTAKNSTDAFRRIASTQSLFVSRADNSVVDRLEQDIWTRVKYKPSGSWYLESNREMADTLMEASEKNAYTLTDRAAFLFKKAAGSINLVILMEGDRRLLNYYHIIVINPEKFPDLNVEGAKAFSAYLVSPEAQKIIAEFAIDRLGEPTFFADGDKTDAELGLPEADFE